LDSRSISTYNKQRRRKQLRMRRAGEGRDHDEAFEAHG
jgi:hypothetical protein